jgi:oxaloacetate decarboxylase alpha subunit
MVTPVSQLVATQAVMNVIGEAGGERWATVSDEMVRYFLGHFYEPAAPVDPDVADRVLSSSRAGDLRHLEPLSLDGARERFGRGIGDEDLLLRLTMPQEQVDAMVKARSGGGDRPLPAARPGRDPLVTLLRELAKRESLAYVRVETGGDLVVWRSAA